MASRCDILYFIPRQAIDLRGDIRHRPDRLADHRTGPTRNLGCHDGCLLQVSAEATAGLENCSIMAMPLLVPMRVAPASSTAATSGQDETPPAALMPVPGCSTERNSRTSSAVVPRMLRPLNPVEVLTMCAPPRSAANAAATACSGVSNGISMMVLSNTPSGSTART